MTTEEKQATTEVIETPTTETEVVVEQAIEVTPVPEKQTETDDERMKRLKEEHIKLQGKRATTKKKINKFTEVEKVAELKRLQKAGHQFSRYYIDIRKTLPVGVVTVNSF